MGYEGSDESKDRNFIVPSSVFQCPAQPSGGDAVEYTSTYPKAQAIAGGRLTLQWPPRGHAKQPHSDVWIFCGEQRLMPTDVFSGNVRQDTLTHRSDKNRVLKRVATMGYATRCTGSDVSWAKCTGDLEVPRDWKSGQSCMWIWELNGGQTYVDCFDVDVAGGVALANDSPSANNTGDVGNQTFVQVQVLVNISDVTSWGGNLTSDLPVPKLVDGCEGLADLVCDAGDSESKHVCDHTRQPGCRLDLLCPHLMAMCRLPGSEVCDAVKQFCQ
jgi:hypothetical protein